MRRKEKEMTDKKEIEAFLKQSRVCRLAMIDGDMPYVVPLNFGYRDGCLFFHSALQGKKIELIRKNPNVCFEMDELIRLKKAASACDWGAEFTSVIGWGRASLVEGSALKKEGLQVIMAQYSDREFDFPDEMLAQTLVIKVEIERMTGKKS